MKKQIRFGVFETNSSSEHSISICTHTAILTADEYELYKSGELKVSPEGDITKIEEFEPEIKKIEQEAGKKWDECPDDEIPKVHRKYSPRYTRDVYIQDEIERYLWGIDAKLDRHLKITHDEREIKGHTYHAISVTSGKVDDDY